LAIQNIVEASIADLQHALTTGALTSVELTTKYFQRIITYDTRGPCLNSIVVFNPDVFDEAAASDARRAAGQSLGNLDGIPFVSPPSHHPPPTNPSLTSLNNPRPSKTAC